MEPGRIATEGAVELFPHRAGRTEPRHGVAHRAAHGRGGVERAGVVPPGNSQRAATTVRGF